MNEQIYEQATEWVISQRGGGLNAQQKRAFDAWLRGSPQHVQAYLEMCALWEDVVLLGANPSADELIARAVVDDNVVQLIRPAAEGAGAPSDALENVDEQSAPTVAEAAVSKRARGAAGQRSTRFIYAFAATVLLAIAAGWIYLGQGVYTTDIGEQRSLVLADGSTIELNSRSRIRVRYSELERHIDLLEGQALFYVAKNKKRPFVVQTGTTRLKAVGTAFDVYRTARGTLVTVVEGRVAVYREPAGLRSHSVRDASNNGGVVNSGVGADTVAATGTGGSGVFDATGLEEIQLAAGEQLLVRPIEAPSVQRANVAAATAWTQRNLVFDSSPLTEVAQEFNRYNKRHLVITDPQLAQFHVSGVFSSAETTLLLRFLRDQPNLIVEETATEIRISPR